MLIQKHYLRPGGLFFTSELSQVTTVLGSCVSVTLYHPATKTAGICHGIFPRGKRRCTDPGKYVSSAVLSLIAAFARKGIPSHHLQAKVFGGAALLEDSGTGGIVGRQNVQVAEDLLQRHSITIHAKNVGGTTGRKIVFQTTTGDVFLKFLHKAALQRPALAVAT